jgi:hypothetical protein
VTDTLTVSLLATRTLRMKWTIPSEPMSTNAPLERRPSRIPFSIPSSQLYYWTRRWQEDEARAMEELERGESRRFTKTADALRWLMSEEID